MKHMPVYSGYFKVIVILAHFGVLSNTSEIIGKDFQRYKTNPMVCKAHRRILQIAF